MKTRLAFNCLIIFLFSVTAVTGGVSQSEPGDDKAGLCRTEDPVVLSGADLPGLVGRPESTIRVMAVRNGVLAPVPFQVDPFDEKGRMIFRRVSSEGGFTDNPKLKPSRQLGGHDELVFMAGDLGGRAGAGMLPQGAAVEVEVVDPLDKGRAWAYVISPAGNAPELSGKVYVRYVPEEDTVFSTHLNFGFTDPAHPAVLTFLALGDGISDPDGLVDLLDSFRMELGVTLKYDLATIVRRQTDLRQSVALFNEGPVRVVRLLRYSVLLVGNIPSPSVDRLNASYRSCISFPNDVSVPFKPGLILEQGTFDLHFDLTRNAVGTSMYHELNPESIIVDGRMDRHEGSFAQGFPLWAAMVNPFGGIVGVVDVRREFLQIPGVSSELTYLDDSSVLMEGEDDPGTYGRIGWRFSGLHNLPGGKYKIDLVLYGLSGGFGKGDEKQFLDIVRHPLNIKTRALETAP